MYRKYIKRGLDILFSLIALAMLWPLIAFIAMCVKVKLGSPVIFKQKRPGLYEQSFYLYKFRTMKDIRDGNGDLLSDEYRITKFGRFLRQTSLDELPELYNIFKGDMSMIGPRPLLEKYLPFYTMEERTRHSVRPGLTGLAQVSGRNILPWAERFKQDIYYVEHLTFRLDLKIIMLTIYKVIKKQDILVGNEQILQDLNVERKDWRRND